MNYQEANREIAVHNILCEDENYKYVLAWNNKKQQPIEIIPILFESDGYVTAMHADIYSHWKPIEDETPSEPQSEADILRKAKEICFKTGYVRRKNWGIKVYTIVRGMIAEGYYEIDDLIVSPEEIVEEWESVDPRE